MNDFNNESLNTMDLPSINQDQSSKQQSSFHDTYGQQLQNNEAKATLSWTISSSSSLSLVSLHRPPDPMEQESIVSPPPPPRSSRRRIWNIGSSLRRSLPRSLINSVVFRRLQAKTRPPQTPASIAMQDRPGAIHIAHPPPGWVNNNNNNNNRASAFQQDEPLDPLMDDEPIVPPPRQIISSQRDAFQSESSSIDLLDIFPQDSARIAIQRLVFSIILSIFITAGVAIAIGAAFGIRDGSNKVVSIRPDAKKHCAVDFSTICDNDTSEFHVPECFKTNYLFLANITGASDTLNQPCDPSHLASLSLAVAITDNDNNNVQYLEDYYMLAILYFSTKGKSWNQKDEWLQNTNVCSWFGVSCSPISSQVVGVNLTDNNLEGSLPSEIGLLTHLTSLAVGGNVLFGGTLPSEIGLLQELTHLSADIEGRLPTELGNCKLLRQLQIESDAVMGPIPSELGRLHNSIEMLVLGHQMSGTIPTEIGLLTHLTFLDLSGEEEMFGTFPSELGRLSSLEFLKVEAGDGFEGEFISHVLDLNKLTSLFIYFKSLSTLPTAISRLSSLKYLHLVDNFFSGTIPTQLGLLSNLQSLQLDGQDLTGSVPTELGQLINLKAMHIERTSITGVIPSELAQISELRRVRLTGNRLDGLLPIELCPKRPLIFAPFCEELEEYQNDGEPLPLYCIDDSQCKLLNT